jgi:predicted RNA-binding Zn ribbon-like protein
VPPEELRFVFLSGRLCLAFCATLGQRWRSNLERLRTADDLARWYVEAGLLDARLPTSRVGLRQARRLREAIYRMAKALIAGQAPSVGDEAIINTAAAAPPLVPRIRHGAASLVAPGPGGEAEAAALSVVARDAVDLFTSLLSSRIRECASSHCGLLFVDLSRPGQRRWCSSTTCGGRERAAAYRRRRTKPQAS